MWSILKGEWRKLRRCQILLVGIVALALCPVVQYGSQLILNPEMRDPNYNFVKLFANVIWGNTQIFLLLAGGLYASDRPTRPAASDRASFRCCQPARPYA